MTWRFLTSWRLFASFRCEDFRSGIGVGRLPKPVIASVEKWAKANAVESRSEAFRRLVERGLAAEAADPAQPAGEARPGAGEVL